MCNTTYGGLRIMLSIKIGLVAFMFVYLGQPGYIFAWYQKLINPLPEWLWKPLGGCVKCFAGQCAFWYFIFTQRYDFITHLVFVSVAILTAMILDKLTTYLDE